MLKRVASRLTIIARNMATVRNTFAKIPCIFANGTKTWTPAWRIRMWTIEKKERKRREWWRKFLGNSMENNDICLEYIFVFEE
jgi:hypothetical protein